MNDTKFVHRPSRRRGLATCLVIAGALLLPACGGGASNTPDAADSASDANGGPDAGAPVLGTVTNVQDLSACPAGPPAGATCKHVTVIGCPGIESEPIDATLAIVAANGTVRGTIVQLSGGGGEAYRTGTSASYQAGGFRQVFVSWTSDWEQTQSLGIKTAACRPATLLKWIFDDPALHAASRATAFCGEGFSAGSGQLGYALAHYGLADYLDYVGEVSGPPFSRIDLGCDGDAPATATVCGATTTMRLPPRLLDRWENIQAPLACGGRSVPAAEIERWKNDSIAFGGLYDYPRTRVEFFDCTFRATAVTAMAQIYYDQIFQATSGDPTRVQFHCYGQADGCQGEGLGTGTQDVIQAMLTGCTPRHQ